MNRLFTARRVGAALTLGLVFGLSACSSLRDAATQASTLGGLITPYKIDVVQGNVITKEQVDALKNGMTRVEVRDVLGTPLLQSVFHANRWDYVFSFRRGGQPEQLRKLAVFFEGSNLVKVEADEMPTEAEFVASLVVRKRPGQDPVMEASEASLKAFQDSNAKSAPAAASAPATPAAAPPANSYPPLEPAGAAR
ncbi:outer membrane protein assembly factor BamE [Hydrogenophaga sp. OTU3427]|uniref:outer membrane protein assembly factor BamE n=1 Tax=Hydrogenophaga sp. OTU3427 TaxID=3043856 RepID=UPI00313CE300